MNANDPEPTQNHISAAILKAGEDLVRSAGFRDTVEVALLLSGTVTMQLSGNQYTLSTGDISTVAPNIVHGVTAFSADAQLLLLTFSTDMIRCHQDHFFYWDFWKPLQDGSIQLPPFLPAEHLAAPMLQRQMLNLLHTDDPFRRFACLMELCLQLIPFCTYPPENEPILGVANKHVRRCMIYIINHYHHKVRLERIARYVKCHPNYLCNIFKAHTGMTIMEYLYYTRVETAAKLLLTEDVSIHQICEISGFPNRNMFYKKFRQIMGMSPTTYRNKHSKQ